MTIYGTIKAAISVKQAAEHYGLKVNRNGMACCPFHNDRHPSLKLNEDYFFCFGCGAKGDVIDLVARLFNMSSYEAAQKLASDFGLDPKPPTVAAMAKPKRPYIRQFREDEMLCFRVLTDYLHLLEDWKVRYAPKTPEEALDDRFVEACQMHCPIEYMADVLTVGDLEERVALVDELMKEGKVQHWGMCEVSADTIRRAHAVCPLTAIQSEYHLMHRDVETNGVLDVCRELGIGFVPYSPINRGFLGGCINEYTVFDPTNDNRQTLPRFQPEAIRANTRILNVLQRFGRTHGMTSAQVALGWLLQKEPWIVPIPGTTKLSHLEENLRSLDFNLAAEEWRALEPAVAAIPVVGDRYNAEQQRQVGR